MPLTLPPEQTARGENRDAINSETSSQSDGFSKNPQARQFDPDFTQNVINATGPKTSPRMRKVVASMIQHIHDFARENEVTVEEWMAGVEMVMSFS